MHSNNILSPSTKQLWKLSFPLMISFLSLFSMVFIDRIFLSFYSTSALNAATSAGTLGWSLILGFSTLAGLAEVFVAQYNGAGENKRLGEPVWQMIWFSLFSILFFLPLGIYGGQFLYGQPHPTNYEFDYFRYTLFLSPGAILLAALTAFFVGQGKTSIIKWLGLIGNIVNVILDPLFIFGYKAIPSMGVKGACLASGIGIIVQAMILLVMFLKKENTENYGTLDWRFKPSAFYSCIKVGLPPAIFVFIELLGWSIFYWMMTQIGKEHILIASICQSILLLFIFFGLGLEKGAAVIAGNLIGAGQIDAIPKLLRSGLKMLSLFACLIIFFFIIYPDFLIEIFFRHPQALDIDLSSQNLTSEGILHLKKQVRSGLSLIAIYMIIEDIRWLINGILTAAGDTLFLMICGAGCVWLFLLIPTYFFVVKTQGSIQTAFSIWILYSIIAALFFYLRFRQGKWKEKCLLIEKDENPYVEETPSA